MLQVLSHRMNSETSLGVCVERQALEQHDVQATLNYLFIVNQQFKDKSINVSQARLIGQPVTRGVSTSAYVTSPDASPQGQQSELLSPVLTVTS